MHEPGIVAYRDRRQGQEIECLQQAGAAAEIDDGGHGGGNFAGDGGILGAAKEPDGMSCRDELGSQTNPMAQRPALGRAVLCSGCQGHRPCSCRQTEFLAGQIAGEGVHLQARRRQEMRMGQAWRQTKRNILVDGTW